jgi:Ca-activated chloride channel family protein
MILVTDGLQDPNPLDINSRWREIDPIEAAKEFKELGVTLYIVNIEPSFNAEKYAPNRRQLQKAAEITGGKLFMVDSNSHTLEDIYGEIDRLEKSPLPIQAELISQLEKTLPKDKLPGLYRTYFLAFDLIALAIMSLSFAILLECTLLRRVP